MMTNREKYPNIFLEPKEFIYENSKCILYSVRFSGLYSLYNYLKSDPEINQKVFPSNKLASFYGPTQFAGKPYKKALEDLVIQFPDDYDIMLQLEKDLKKYSNKVPSKYVSTKDVCGGFIDVPSYVAGVPKCFHSQKVVNDKKFIKINMSLGYNASTTSNEIRNRAIILSNIITAFERNGYDVLLNAFELSTQSSGYNYGSENPNEYLLIEVKLKNFNEKTNIKDIYKTTFRVEFLRRLLFRVKETVDLKNYYWADGYGRVCNENETRKVLRLDDNSLYFGYPKELGILGKSLSDDFESAIKHMNLGDKIDVDAAVKKFNDDQMKLVLK